MIKGSFKFRISITFFLMTALISAYFVGMLYTATCGGFRWAFSRMKHTRKRKWLSGPGMWS